MAKIERIQEQFLWRGQQESKPHLLNWNLVLRDKKHGGLALGGIVDRNIALLGKWLWKYPSLWASVIRSKFGHNSNGWDTSHFTSSSFHSIWKGIYQSLPLFSPHIRLALGNGNRVWFWLDPWADSQLFSIWFPHLFNLSTCKDGTIASFFSSSSSWDFQFRHNLRDFEIEEFLSLSSLIHQFHPSPLRQIVELGPFPFRCFLCLFLLPCP